MNSNRPYCTQLNDGNATHASSQQAEATPWPLLDSRDEGSWGEQPQTLEGGNESKQFEQPSLFQPAEFQDAGAGAATPEPSQDFDSYVQSRRNLVLKKCGEALKRYPR